MGKSIKSIHESKGNLGSIERNASISEKDDAVVEPGKVVQLDISVSDDLGCEIQADHRRIDVSIGAGQLLPNIEGALVGLRRGDRRRVRLSPNEAFGEHDAEKVVEFDRGEFPPDVLAGDHFEAERDEGGRLVLRVVSVHSDYVLVDLNHPLAGQFVDIEFLVQGIRPASKSELELPDNRQKSDDSARASRLLPVESLLRGRTER
jgi:FKBP-type peptidyl-prolyl cis-trans isomerase 2